MARDFVTKASWCRMKWNDFMTNIHAEHFNKAFVFCNTEGAPSDTVDT